MTAPAKIEIIGSPIACEDGVKETWRDLAKWLGQKLQMKYDTAVSLTYYDLFDPDCPPLPDNAQLPLVLINGVVITNGGKLSMPAISRHLATLGIAPR